MSGSPTPQAKSPAPFDDIELPPLPLITDPRLAELVFTHSSVANTKSANPLQLVAGAADEDNEKLEHIGDSLLGVIVTTLLQDMFRDLKQGPATSLKARLVSNATNAQLSRYYSLPSRLVADRNSLMSLRRQDSVAANLFEAYIAGVYYSYLNTNPRALTPPRTPQKNEKTPSIADTLSPSARSVTHGQALDHLAEWLTDIYTILAKKFLEDMRAEQRKASPQGEGETDDSTLDTMAVGSLATLNQHCISHEKGIPEYKDVMLGQALWRCTVIATRKDESILQSHAVRSTKQAARTIAAYKICLEMGLCE